ncbi:MAG: gliding motility lipoprotein GldD [bacterium]
MYRKLYIICCIAMLIGILVGCKPNTYQPKPYGYFRIELPEHSYVSLDTIEYYTTNISKYCEVNNSTSEFIATSDHWINLFYPELNATIHLSYKKITPEIFQTVSEENRTLAYKHTVRADAIAESFFANDTTRTYCMLFEMKGNAASPVQFFITDSTENFLRGSLYFNNIPNADSIAPSSIYVEQDIIELIEQLRWK